MSTFGLKGDIIRVLDGDTVVVAVKVRLSNLYAPELGTAEGEKEKVRFRRWCKKHNKVLIEQHGSDIYNRLLGRLMSDDSDALVYM